MAEDIAGPWTHHEAELDGVRLHWAEAGTGRPVVLLHGFPEFWYGWRLQLPALAAAGFRAVAPDLRGYGRSERPRGLREYAIDRLVGDVAALAEHLGGPVDLVGHDWGGVIAWCTSLFRPDVVRRLAIVNAPHPRVMARVLRESAEQRRRSWYAAFFQLPLLPEWALRRNDFALLERVFRRDPRRPGAYTDADIARYKDAFRPPGALRAAVDYYRAFRRYRPEGTDRPVRAPTLVVWGMRDRHLGPELLEGLDRYVPDLRVERLPNASHWVPADEPERLSALLVEHFAG